MRAAPIRTILALSALAWTGTAQAQSACDRLARHGAAIAQATRTPKISLGIPYLHPWVTEAPKAAPSRKVMAQAAALLTGDPKALVTFEPLGGGAWRAENIAGSADCTTDLFFRVGPHGSVEQLPQPEAFDELCWTSGRHVGVMDGKTVLVEVSDLDRPVLGTDVEITPWNGARWGPACQLAIRWRDTFAVSERFCADAAVCDAAAEIAPALASAMAHGRRGAGLETVAPPPDHASPAYPARLVRLKQAYVPLTGGKDWKLPTFGAKARTPYVDYSGTLHPTLVSLDGKTYVALVGIGGIGWRELGDYLITIFREDDASQTPLAGIVVSRDAMGPPQMSVSTPKPWRH